MRHLQSAATSVQRPGREADRSSPPSATVKKVWSYTSIPTYTYLRQSGLLWQYETEYSLFEPNNLLAIVLSFYL